MLASKIVTTGSLGSILESEILRYRVQLASTRFYQSPIEWKLTGNVPNSLLITDGIIIGRLLTLEDQNLPPEEFFPKERLKLDGSNYDKIGRYKYPSKTFTFTIEHTYSTYLPQSIVTKDNIPPIVTVQELTSLYTEESVDTFFTKHQELLNDPNVIALSYQEETITSEVSLTLLKNGNITNKLFLIAYLETDVTYIDTEEGKIPIKHSITHNGKEYTFDNIEEFKKEY
jgi:hypothetical protein